MKETVTSNQFNERLNWLPLENYVNVSCFIAECNEFSPVALYVIVDKLRYYLQSCRSNINRRQTIFMNK